MNDELDPRVQALLLHLKEYAADDIDDSFLDSSSILTVDTRDYLVVDESERETKWTESIQSYIDECILPELPERYRGYFDDEAFIRDAKFDGAGHALAFYDGHEHEVMIKGHWFFIYRLN